MGEDQQRFSPLAQRWIKRYIPDTYRFTRVSQAELLAHRQDWVLKSAYGCEGEETICGPFVIDETWGEAVAKALPAFSGCQRFFHTPPEPTGPLCDYGGSPVWARGAAIFSLISVDSA